MADVDEDFIPSTSGTGADDLEDETQDFRFLAQLTASSATTGGAGPVVPKRGTKDFEPNPTRSQASALDASRLAMHNALSAPRVHSGKNHLVGQYLAEEASWRWDGSGLGSGGATRRNGRCVVVYKFKSSHSKVMGQGGKNNWVWFLPEEALYLLERGSLDVRWPDIEESMKAVDKAVPVVSEGDDEDQGQTSHEEAHQTGTQAEESLEEESATCQANVDEDPQVGELPMSLQGAYASFIGKDGLTLERYSVYAGLKRSGYIVQRAPTWHDDLDALPDANGHANPESIAEISTAITATPHCSDPHARSNSISGAVGLIRRICSWLFQPQRGESCPSLGPLLAPGLYRNYADIFRALSLIPYHDPTSPSTTSTNPQPSIAAAEISSLPPARSTRTPQSPFRIHLHAWKPTTTYRKTAPPPPDYRIAVIDARTTSMPTLSQIGDLLDSLPDDLLSKDKAGGKLETRIKHGKRNVILAVVDMGIVSYLRLSDACFGAEKLFEEKLGRGAKGKGRGKGKGSGGAHGNRVQGQKSA